VLAGAIVPALVLALGWERGAIVIGVCCFALAVLIAPVRARYDTGLNPRAPVSLAAAFAPVGLVARTPRLRELAVTGLVYAGVQITLVTYLVTFLVDSFALSLVLAGVVMAVSQLASVLGRLLWGALADRALARRTMLGLLGLGMGASALATLAAGPEWPRWLLFVFASLFGATAVGWNGVFLAEIARRAPLDRVSDATGGSAFFTFLGVVVTPPLFHLVLGLTGSYGATYAVFGLPALAAGLRLLATARIGRDAAYS
jgi:nitrate/nitrite transporter NarK